MVNVFGWSAGFDHWYYVGKIILAIWFSLLGGWMHYVITSVFAGGRKMWWFGFNHWRFTSANHAAGISILLIVLWILAVVYEFTFYLWWMPIVTGVIGFLSILAAMWMVYWNKSSMKAKIKDREERKYLTRAFLWITGLTAAHFALTYLNRLWAYIPALIPSGDYFFIMLINSGFWLLIAIGITIYTGWARSETGKGSKNPGWNLTGHVREPCDQRPGGQWE